MDRLRKKWLSRREGVQKAQPFVCSVPVKIEAGTSVHVSGKVDSQGLEFYIGLQVGEPIGTDSDIALLFKPVLDGSTQLSCSSFITENGEQSSEEQILYLPIFPFQREKDFSVEISVKDPFYQIFVDGQHVLDFCHRIEPGLVTHLTLDGDATFRTVSFRNQIGSDITYQVDNDTVTSLGKQFYAKKQQDRSTSIFADETKPYYYKRLLRPGSTTKPVSMEMNKHGVNTEGDSLSDADFETSITEEGTIFTFKTAGRDSNRSIEVPHFQMLSEGLAPGKAIYIDGVVSPGAKRMIVSLQTDANALPNTTSALYIRPDFEAGLVSCNSFVLKNWGQEIVEQKPFPFADGKPFLLKILMNEDGFSIFINGSLHMFFSHRTSFEKITHIMVDGDTQFYTVECPDELELPYVNAIPGGLYVGKSILIEGTPWRDTGSPGPGEDDTTTVSKVEADLNFEENVSESVKITRDYDENDDGGLEKKVSDDGGEKLPQLISYLMDNQSFQIGLQTSDSDYPNTTIAFQMKILTRFGSRKIICNSFIKGIWGNEEVVFGNLAFTEDARFAIKITVQTDSFLIWLNEATQFYYKHRIPIEEVSHLCIDGDMTLDLVSYRDRWLRQKPGKILQVLRKSCCTCCEGI